MKGMGKAGGQGYRAGSRAHYRNKWYQKKKNPYAESSPKAVFHIKWRREYGLFVLILGIMFPPKLSRQY